MPEQISEEMVNVLEAVWISEELGDSSPAEVVAHATTEVKDELLVESERAGNIERLPDGQLKLTNQGLSILEKVIGRDRLVKRLVVNVLGKTAGENGAGITSVERLNLAEQGRVAYVSARNFSRFQKLSSLGITPGIPVKLHQRFPSFVIQCEETQIALEEEIARDIYVWRQ